MARYGYARISTRSQRDDSQLDALRAAGCERIRTDTASGKLARRPEWDNCLDHLRAGDELAVTRLSRMARSARHLTEVATHLADRGTGLVVLKQGIDTTTPAGRFTFHVLAAMDEMLADLISEGTEEGLESARARGRAGGRKPKLTGPPGRGGPRHVRGQRRQRQTQVHRRRDRRNLRRVPQNRLPAFRTIRWPPPTRQDDPAVTRRSP